MILWLGAQGEGPAHPQLIEIDAMADLAARPTKTAASIRVSAKTGDGLAELLGEIVSRAKLMLPPADGYAVNARQRGYLADAGNALADAAEAQDWLIVAEHLRLARLALDALTGRAHTEDLLDNLFGTFCVGK
jgi:tRNA modification GTPase